MELGMNWQPFAISEQNMEHTLWTRLWNDYLVEVKVETDTSHMTFKNI